MSLDPHIFRAYDVRGKAHSQITQEACKLIGQAFGTELRRRYKIDHPTVVLGLDARTHGPEFEDAVLEGLLSTGCNVLRIGETPSPVNYFTICTRKLDGGIQVTASHNPKEDNGLKLQIRNAEAFAGNDLQRLKAMIDAEDFINGEGSVEEIDAITPYIDHLQTMFTNIGESMRIAVDSGNGVAGPAYCKALRMLGAEVIELYTEPDGTFPNHAADPSKYDTLKELQQTVTDHKLTLGFAFDGDGDRLGLVDEQGKIRTADEILLALAKDHLTRTPGGKVVFTVSNSGILESEVRTLGGEPIMCKVGHSFVEHAMHEHGALLGGEQSGHFFCAEDYFGFDDALIAAIRLLAITKDYDSCSAVFADFPMVYQSPELRPHCNDEDKADVIARITEEFSKEFPVETMDGTRIDFGNGGWAGIRQSNTSPCISICMEARSKEELARIETCVLDALKKYPEIRF